MSKMWMSAQPRAATIDLVQPAPERAAGNFGKMFGVFSTALLAVLL